MQGTHMMLGEKVVAAKRITEAGFKEPGVEHVHAEPGDVGVIVDVFAETGMFMVRWLRSGTACDCDPVADLNPFEEQDQEHPATPVLVALG